MNKQIVLVAMLILFSFSFISLTSAAIDTIPVTFSYDNGTKVLTVMGENLYWTQLIQNNSFNNTVNVIRTTEVPIISLEASLDNMTKICNDSMAYLPKYIDCEVRRQTLEDYWNQTQNQSQTLTQCNSDLEGCRSSLNDWYTNGKVYNIYSPEDIKKSIDSTNSSASGTKWLFALIGAVIGGLGVYFFFRSKSSAKKLSGFANLPPAS